MLMTASATIPAPSYRRGTELALTIFAVVLAILAYAAVGIGTEGSIPAGTVAYGAGLAALFLIAHFAVRRFAPYADPLILPCVAMLNGLGLVMIRRLDLYSAESARQHARALPRADAPLQLIWTT